MGGGHVRREVAPTQLLAAAGTIFIGSIAVVGSVQAAAMIAAMLVAAMLLARALPG